MPVEGLTMQMFERPTRLIHGLVLAATLTLPGVAWAQDGCPELRTIDRTRQQVEWLRDNREAGIARLPTAQHQRLALESLYRWYWYRVARLEADRRDVEARCARANQLRSEGGLTRQAWPAQPAADDPFSPTSPAGPVGPPQRPAMYPAYPRYPDPGSWDPFVYQPPPPRVYPGQRVWTYPPYRRSRP
jgi:hypothetical protein